MYGVAPALSDPVRIGLVGAGRIGTSHATLLARRVPGASLRAVADPRPEAAQALAAAFGCRATTAGELFADPDDRGGRDHGLVRGARRPGRGRDHRRQGGVLREADGSDDRADVDRGIDAARAAGVALQVGFNRRFAADFAAAHQLVLATAGSAPRS